MIIFLNSLCHYFWFWDGSIWVLLGKSFSIFKLKHGWSCFLTVFVVIFDFEGAVPGFYQVNLSQFSSLSMADHVFWKFLSLSLIFTLEYLGVPGSTWEYFCYSVFLSVEYLGVLGRTREYLIVPGITWEYLGVPLKYHPSWLDP